MTRACMYAICRLSWPLELTNEEAFSCQMMVFITTQLTNIALLTNIHHTQSLCPHK